MHEFLLLRIMITFFFNYASAILGLLEIRLCHLHLGKYKFTFFVFVRAFILKNALFVLQMSCISLCSESEVTYSILSADLRVCIFELSQTPVATWGPSLTIRQIYSRCCFWCLMAYSDMVQSLNIWSGFFQLYWLLQIAWGSGRFPQHHWPHNSWVIRYGGCTKHQQQYEHFHRPRGRNFKRASSKLVCSCCAAHF